VTVPARIEQFLVEDLELGEGGSIGHDRELLSQGLLDSAGIMETVAFLEESFSLEIEDADLVPENFQTIDAMVALVSRKGAS
jgi:acyl carrier protein